MSPRRAFSEASSRMSPSPGEAGIGKDCPSAEELLLFHRGELPFKARKRVAAHISRCPSCGQDSIFLREILTAKNDLMREIDVLVPANKRAPSKPVRPSLPGPRIFVPRLAAPLTIALLACVSYIVLTTPRRRAPTAEIQGQIPESVRSTAIPFLASHSVFPWSDFTISRYDVGEKPDFASGRPEDGRGAGTLSLFAPASISPGTAGENASLLMRDFSLPDGLKSRSLLREFTLSKSSGD
jgi:hypothetical protein